ncbi:hypothetical protein Pan216_22420 [Planctomycetes bacterium Pan216]|uniref:MucB/RseB N-terminal domain-containing protein n=1 Tax=Kolteria novifilia TaxID=2527975 RepID=A0A518B387_9BACT|nr:hypothetical protein Pan216_22420 [Planctomycetes bacterium Pan216]
MNPIPYWLRGVVSLLAAGHLGAVAVMTLAAPSGPWAVAQGADWATPPQLAQFGAEKVGPYLDSLKMTHNYHFAENFISSQPDGGPDARFRAKLLDADGKTIDELTFPDPKAWGTVRHRQRLLARALAEDELVVPTEGEMVPAANQRVERVLIWQMGEGQRGAVKAVPRHLVPRDRPTLGPSRSSMILASSYARHLLRHHDAAAVEISRTSRPSIPPDVLFLDGVPQEAAFDDSTVTFGETHAHDGTDAR